MVNTVTIELPAFGLLSRNTPSSVVTFDDPTPAGAQILWITVTTRTRPLFYDLFGKGVVAGERFYLGGVTPFTSADLIGTISTFGPQAGQGQVATPHSFVCEGAPPRYASGGINSLLIDNEYNPIEMSGVSLEFTYSRT